MAPTHQKVVKRTFEGKEGIRGESKHVPGGVQKKRKWIPEHKIFQGSVKEGQGFALKRKQKVQHEYNKLLRKEKKTTVSAALYKEDYPEHLKHLYMAEAERLKNEAWSNRVNRSKSRMKEREKVEDDAVPARRTEAPEATGPSEPTDSDSGKPESTGATETLPMSNRMKKKMEKKKTSYQKTKEEYEKMKEKRRKKKEEYLKNKQQREEAIQKYQQKKMETFQMLSKKTKKGQPNLNLQMEYLLQKIQKTQQ
ncbi:thyroid transcription factor 1-associated protein 26 homolog [Aulostomus maculatus]